MYAVFLGDLGSPTVDVHVLYVLFAYSLIDLSNYFFIYSFTYLFISLFFSSLFSSGLSISGL